jgi:SET domain-containing protein
MRNPFQFSTWIFTVGLMVASFVPIFVNSPGEQAALLQINKEYEKRTAIKKSRIPHAGNGLFAVVTIKEGEVIGELGGRLMVDNDKSLGNHYIASIPEYAWKEAHPYKYIDSKAYGANVSRINFAPSKINGIDTNFQNATVKQLCNHPYFVFLALNDIEPGAEIWSSYGPHYEYDTFMRVPAVRDFFCALLKMDCREEFIYSH